MGFKKMYRGLQELFPQVDAGFLIDVAAENSEDAAAAVEAVFARGRGEVRSSDGEKAHEEESGVNTSDVSVGAVGDEPTSMEAVDEIIADAGNNKETLLSRMDAAIHLMEEVEVKEKAVEQAKAEAASTGDADIQYELEELKQTVQRTNESNAKRAGQVYGEKEILATELKELQSRAISLSDEGDESLSILDELSQTLKVRLAAAEVEIKSAEQEKVEKEMAAMKALAEQESIMEKAVQESKVLELEAVENEKLQEFLMDRGRVVDGLQGEMAALCKGVRLLKESLDKNVHLSKCLSTSQMMSCVDSSMTQSERDPSSGGDYRKALVDNGWEVFDDGVVSSGDDENIGRAGSDSSEEAYTFVN